MYFKWTDIYDDCLKANVYDSNHSPVLLGRITCKTGGNNGIITEIGLNFNGFHQGLTKELMEAIAGAITAELEKLGFKCTNQQDPSPESGKLHVL